MQIKFVVSSSCQDLYGQYKKWLYLKYQCKLKEKIYLYELEEWIESERVSCQHQFPFIHILGLCWDLSGQYKGDLSYSILSVEIAVVAKKKCKNVQDRVGEG